MNAFDILLIVVIGVIVFFAARHTLRMRKNGGCSCGAGGCSGSCPACGGTCHCNTDRNKPGET